MIFKLPQYVYLFIIAEFINIFDIISLDKAIYKKDRNCLNYVYSMLNVNTQKELNNYNFDKDYNISSSRTFNDHVYYFSNENLHMIKWLIKNNVKCESIFIDANIYNKLQNKLENNQIFSNQLTLYLTNNLMMFKHLHIYRNPGEFTTISEIFINTFISSNPNLLSINLTAVDPILVDIIFKKCTNLCKIIINCINFPNLFNDIMYDKFVNLMYISLTSITIKKINLIMFKNLKIIKIKNCNQLSIIDLNSTKLSLININKCLKLETINLVSCINLAELNIFDCDELKSIDLTLCIKLKIIEIDIPIDIKYSTLFNLEELYLNTNNLDILLKCDNLTKLLIHGDFQIFTLPSLKKLKSLVVESSLLSKINCDDCALLTNIQTRSDKRPVIFKNILNNNIIHKHSRYR